MSEHCCFFPLKRWTWSQVFCLLRMEHVSHLKTCQSDQKVESEIHQSCLSFSKLLTQWWLNMLAWMTKRWNPAYVRSSQKDKQVSGEVHYHAFSHFLLFLSHRETKSSCTVITLLRCIPNVFSLGSKLLCCVTVPVLWMIFRLSAFLLQQISSFIPSCWV